MSTNKVPISLLRMTKASILRRWGNGWSLLGDSLKEAVIAKEVFHVFAGRDDSTTIKAEDMTAFYHAMLVDCELEDPE